MSQVSAKGAPQSRGGNRLALLSLLVAASLILVAIPLHWGSAAGTTSSPYNEVQISITTTNSTIDSYYVSAYNGTGGLVASYQSQFPAASFELPNGNYIFAVTATVQQSGYYPPVPLQASSSQTALASQSASGVTVSTPPIRCCGYPPLVEYGYAVQQVSGPTYLSIATRSVNATPLATLTIQARYPNGTAASGASVYASVLGDTDGWSSGNSAVSMYATTNSQGEATLIAPSAPIQVTVSASIPIVLPENVTVIHTIVAGQEVNVTAYWEPSYISFEGQALILPPQTSALITLHYQPVQYPIVYSSGQSASGSPGTTTASGPVASQSSPVATKAIGGQALDSQQPANSGTSSSELILLGAAALMLAALSIGLLAARARAKRTMVNPTAQNL